ncbi:hypothetical protein Nepgr_006624 [Nepenthes gracilis]|uniref:Uncharacterized protein n=1 Tax=Nepenthes gracilis TaxID=150966 RepID=A0AAD3XHJ0_NEPGR|nr:hypothetical protein Nepgr_006624 [Nepenthes gracilis]
MASSTSRLSGSLQLLVWYHADVAQWSICPDWMISVFVSSVVNSMVCHGEPAVLASFSGIHHVGFGPVVHEPELSNNRLYPLLADMSICSSKIPHPGTLNA